MLLTQQRQMFDEIYREVLHKQNQNDIGNKEKIREAEFNRLMREQYNQNQNAASSPHTQRPTTSTSATRPQGSTASSTTYSFNQGALQNLGATVKQVISPNTKPASLYPDIGTTTTPLTPSRETQDPMPSRVFVSNNQEPVRSAPPVPPQSRARSVSRQRTSKSEEDNDVKCPTCKKTYTLQIFQCPKGHSSCKTCMEHGHPCAICYNKITNMRNITLEAFISEKSVKCLNSSFGCSLYIKLADMNNHLKVCLFRDMPCPLTALFGQCSWKGKMSQMASHFDGLHLMHRQANIDTEMHLLNVRNSPHMVHFIVIGTFNFLFHVKNQDNNLCMAVQALGTDNSASKWTYEIHVYNKREPRRKYECTDICHSINKPVNEIISEWKCAVIPLCHISTFINENKLTYKLYIRKKINNNEFTKNAHSRGARRRT
ncbi:E3 ubiquitin-protein ligase Siah1-like isoform X2 [Achroia grisella]|uniref:E3 ubiquitin-protein ligase Siah1-like isoform X2 n=1 Tax=Achroia grisella TaxID=688607 RepID=UPI0027D2234A|nr:E3 ubiquitin-protein ligase Siah1-like isoform X2 [Achroia grisella]